MLLVFEANCQTLVSLESPSPLVGSVETKIADREPAPTEVLERILLAAVANWDRRLEPTRILSLEIYRISYLALSSVCQQWHDIVKSNRFERIMLAFKRRT